MLLNVGSNNNGGVGRSKILPDTNTGTPLQASSAEAMADLAEGWEHCETDDGQPFYHNTITGESQWEAPAASSTTAKTMAKTMARSKVKSAVQMTAVLKEQVLDFRRDQVMRLSPVP